MEQFIFDKRNGLWYELCGDYCLPGMQMVNGLPFCKQRWRSGGYAPNEAMPIQSAFSVIFSKIASTSVNTNTAMSLPQMGFRQS